MNRLVAILTAFGVSLLLGACAALSGKHGSFAIYAPQLDLSAHAQDNAGVPWQLLVDTPQSSGTLDTARIAVMPSPGVLEVYADARWSDPAPTLLRNLIVRAFETDARVNGVSAVDAGLGGDYLLAINLHDFQIELAGGTPRAVIRLTAKLYDRSSNRIVASHALAASADAGSTDAASAARAFELAINELMPQLVEWTIAQGNGHWSAPASDKANARE